MTLADLVINKASRIVGFSDAGRSFGRLHSMGVIPGAEVVHLRTAPLGDPMQVRVEGTLLSIRKCDAQQILVELI